MACKCHRIHSPRPEARDAVVCADTEVALNNYILVFVALAGDWGGVRSSTCGRSSRGCGYSGVGSRLCHDVYCGLGIFPFGGGVR